MSDPNNDAMIQEVDDELRKEQLTALWKSYGKYIIGVAVTVVLVVAGRQGWDEYLKTTQEEASTTYQAVVDAAKDAAKDPVVIWTDGVSALKGGYGSLAGMQLAAAKLDAGDMDGAIAAFDAIAAQAGGDPDLKGLAQIQTAMIYVQKSDYAAARGRLSLLSGIGKPWHHSATELLALIDVEEGLLDDAMAKYTSLALATDVPATISERASKMLAYVEARVKAETAAEGVVADDTNATSSTISEGNQ